MPGSGKGGSIGVLKVYCLDGVCHGKRPKGPRESQQPRGLKGRWMSEIQENESTLCDKILIICSRRHLKHQRALSPSVPRGNF